MKFLIIIILALLAIIALVNVMVILEEDEIYKEGQNERKQHNDRRS